MQTTTERNVYRLMDIYWKETLAWLYDDEEADKDFLMKLARGILLTRCPEIDEVFEDLHPEDFDPVESALDEVFYAQSRRLEAEEILGK